MNNFPYKTYVNWSDEDFIFVASCPAFPGLKAHGRTIRDASKELIAAGLIMVQNNIDLNRENPKSDL